MNKNQSNSLLNNFFLFLFIAISIISYSHTKILSHVDYQFQQHSKEPDYSSLNYWASHPWKIDPADNIPSSIQNKNKDSLADVFFIHPTTYTEVSMPMGWNAEINNESLNKKTDDGTILYQASVFNQHCRIFAPRYRQANL